MLNYVLNGNFRFENIEQIPKEPQKISSEYLCDKWRLAVDEDTIIGKIEDGVKVFVKNYTVFTQRNLGELLGNFTLGLDIFKTSVDKEIKCEIQIMRWMSNIDLRYEVKYRKVHVGQTGERTFIPLYFEPFEHDRYQITISITGVDCWVELKNICLTSGINHHPFICPTYDTELKEIQRYQQVINLFKTGIREKIHVYEMIPSTSKSIKLKNPNGIFLDKPVHISCVEWNEYLDAVLLTANSYSQGHFKNFNDNYLLIIDGDL